MVDAEDLKNGLAGLADAVAGERGADVLLYAGPIAYPRDDEVIDLCKCRSRRENVVLVLSTFGGDADAAYRIARCLQRSFKKITVLLDGVCKSAGTMLVLGSDELVLSDHAELGPLDVQILKDDDIVGRRSGLTPTQALLSLAGLTEDTFRKHFLSMRFEVQLTTKMSAQIASEMAIGVFKEIYAQIDPIRLGEIDRAMNIAAAYGERLVRGRGNAKEDALGRLLAAYPSHEFVIDREEAGELFNSVRAPTDAEQALLTHLGRVVRFPDGLKLPMIQFLCSERLDAQSGETREAKDGARNAQDGREVSAGTAPPDRGADRAHEQGQSKSRGKGSRNGSSRGAVNPA